MICGMEFMDQAVKLRNGVNDQSLWLSRHASEKQEQYPSSPESNAKHAPNNNTDNHGHNNNEKKRNNNNDIDLSDSHRYI